jgi:hypothetical protein
METIRQTQKKYCSIAIIIAIGMAVFFILSGHKPLGKGLMLGTIFSIINFILIGETVPMKIGASRKKTRLISLGSIFLRYILLAVPLVLGIKLDQFNMIAVVSGIFSVQLVILADHLIQYRLRQKTG